MNETIKNLAAALGDGIAASEVLVGYREAKSRYETNAELREAMFEYNTQRTILGNEFKKDVAEQSSELIEMIRERIDTLGRKIAADPDYRAYADAQQEVGKLMQEVNSEISFHVFGERPCTHDCSSCQSNCASRASEEE